ncbi:hypothetical protein P3T23_001609 [Paraburkholderia sp. GAS448]|jgi:hypothetical protein|uniref:hypothetical protein n=1 Tax=Paraburkholderia sp. GAS448 TaxID=3035136 RepID=UPI003D1E93BA
MNTESRSPAGKAQRVHASHMVEEELAHLEWATRQPVDSMLSPGYWHRRVLAIKCGFELTQQQGQRIDAILMRIETVLKRLDERLR